MFRLSRTTDYGIVLLAHLARGDCEGAPHTARELAEQVELPAPMVSKILKRLARAELLESHRGSKGGYRLTRQPEHLSVAEMVVALEGPVALTDCSLETGLCEHQRSCAVRDPWQVINRAVRDTLSGMTLADLIDPKFPAAGAPLQILGRSLLSEGADAPPGPSPLSEGATASSGPSQESELS